MVANAAEDARIGPRRPLRRIGLTLFFGSVACNAAIAIYALLAPSFSSTDGKILGTSLCVTAALVVALACLPALERGLATPIPLLSAMLGAVGCALLIAALWADPGPDLVLQLAGTTLALGLAGTVVSLLELARLSPRLRVVRTVAVSLTALAAALILVAIWFEPHGSLYPRLLGVVLVSLAALCVTIPVLHRLSRRGNALGAPHVGGASVSFCPNCGAHQPAGTPPSFTCPECSVGFTVRARTVSGETQEVARPVRSG